MPKKTLWRWLEKLEKAHRISRVSDLTHVDVSTSTGAVHDDILQSERPEPVGDGVRLQREAKRSAQRQSVRPCLGDCKTGRKLVWDEHKDIVATS